MTDETETTKATDREDEEATLARGEDAAADAVPYLASRKPVGKSRERHARETTARAAPIAERSRAWVERVNYLERRAPDLLALVESEELSVYRAYQVARERRNGLDLPPDLARESSVVRETAASIERVRRQVAEIPALAGLPDALAEVLERWQVGLYFRMKDYYESTLARGEAVEGAAQ